MMTDDHRYAEAVRLAIDKSEAGESLDDILVFLRASGFHMGGCMRVLSEAGLCARRDAKLVVYNSPAWADVQDAYGRFHEALIREITEEQDQ